jgi:hypothetical protein
MLILKFLGLTVLLSQMAFAVEAKTCHERLERDIETYGKMEFVYDCKVVPEMAKNTAKYEQRLCFAKSANAKRFGDGNDYFYYTALRTDPNSEIGGSSISAAVDINEKNYSAWDDRLKFENDGSLLLTEVLKSSISDSQSYYNEYKISTDKKVINFKAMIRPSGLFKKWYIHREIKYTCSEENN